MLANASQEEDFASQIFNRPLLHEFAVEEVLTLLQKAHRWLQDSDTPSDFKDALASRTRWRISFLQLLQDCTLGKRPSSSALEEIHALINVIETSAGMGQPTANVSFTLKIQRRLASSVPPRPMVVVEPEKAFQFFRQITTNITSAFEMLDISCSNDLLVAYQTFMAQAAQPAVYVRALLQSFLTINNSMLGRYNMKDFISEDIRCLVLPRGLLPDLAGDMVDIPTDQQIEHSSQLDLFVNRCAQSFLNLFRTFCLNRCRVRRTLCHATIEWDQIQAEAEELDTSTQFLANEEPVPYPPGEAPTFSYSFSSWVYHYKLMQLRHVLQMGFELSIYAPHEFSLMYWYLSFLSNTHLSHLERISFFVSSNGRTNPNVFRHEDVEGSLRQLYRHFTWLKATEALAKALHRIFTVIQRHGHLPLPSLAYTSDRFRYELRMRPFLHMSIPEPISLDTAQRASSLRELSDKVLLDQASKATQIAKKAWEEVLKEGWNTKPLSAAGASINTSVVAKEWTKDVRNSMKACIGTGIAIAELSKALQSSGSSAEGKLASIQIDIPPAGHRDRWHSSWPVPKIST